MAHYDAHRNRGFDGYGIKEPIYGGRPAAIVAYSAMEERYIASSEQIVKFGDYTSRPDLQLKKGDEYDHSPRYGHVNGSPRDSPRKTFHSANSPPAGHFSSVYAPHLDSPRKKYRDNHPSAYGARHSSPHDSPRKNFGEGRVGRFSSDDDDSSDDEVECRDGVCYPKPKHGGGGRGGGRGYDYDYGKEKKKTNGYAADNYPMQDYTTDPHHQTSNAEKLPNGNNIYGSHSNNNAPAHTKPTTDAYYDRFSYPATNDDHNRNNYTHSKNEPYAVPAPIKTRPDRGESSPVSAVAQWTPFAASSPRKGHQGRGEVIDTTEAQRRYGNAPPQSGPPASRMFGAAIDSETAAKKYGGVFVK